MDKGTAKEPMTIIPGKALRLPKALTHIHHKAKVMTNINNTLLYNHGCGQSLDMEHISGVVAFVPQIKISSASSVVCDLKTSENRT
ncbi:MAG: hypothetical protein ACI4TK_06565, partial [Agathobacter sp.]